jgi:hypothetical protein
VPCPFCDGTGLNETARYLLSLAKRVAGAPVAIITESGDDWVAYNGSEPGAFEAIIDKRVALVEIVGGEEG